VRALVIQFDVGKGLGLLEQPLRDVGCDLDVRLAPTAPPPLDGAAGLIVLGGLANPGDEDPALDAADATLRDALARDVPVLGVCLGAELLARAAGAPTPPCEPEYGFHTVRLEPAAADHPVLGGLPPEFSVFEAHGYTWEPPAGAVVLAHTARTRQAFRLAPAAWGLQFHFEPDAAMIEEWTSNAGVRATLRSAGIDRDALVEQAQTHTLPWVEHAASIADGFVDVMRSST
jgi:GMP synthase (glutamine-hydrolysing)